MNKRFLIRINVLLGVLSLWLAGCHSSKATVKEEPRRPMMKYGTPEVRAMYGVASPEMQPADTTVAPADTVVMPQQAPERPQRPDAVLVKYGVPPVRNNQ